MKEEQTGQLPRYMKYRSSLQASAHSSSSGARSKGEDGGVDLQEPLKGQQQPANLSTTNNSISDIAARKIHPDSKFSKYRNASVVQNHRSSNVATSSSIGSGSFVNEDLPDVDTSSATLLSTSTNKTSDNGRNEEHTGSYTSISVLTTSKPQHGPTKIPRYAQYRTSLSQSSGARSQSNETIALHDAASAERTNSGLDPPGTNPIHREYNGSSARYATYKSKLSGSVSNSNNVTSVGDDVELVIAQSSGGPVHDNKINNNNNVASIPVTIPNQITETSESSLTDIFGINNENKHVEEENVEVRLKDDRVVVGEKSRISTNTIATASEESPQPSSAYDRNERTTSQPTSNEQTKNRYEATGIVTGVAAGATAATIATSQQPSSSSSTPARSTSVASVPTSSFSAESTSAYAQAQSRKAAAATAASYSNLSSSAPTTQSYLQRVDDFLRLQTGNIVPEPDSAPEAKKKLERKVSFSDTEDDDQSMEDSATFLSPNTVTDRSKSVPSEQTAIASVDNPYQDVSKLMVGSKERFSELLDLTNVTPNGIKNINLLVQLWDEIDRDSRFLQEQWKNGPGRSRNQQQYTVNNNKNSNVASPTSDNAVIQNGMHHPTGTSATTKQHNRLNNKMYRGNKQDADSDIEEGNGGMLHFQPSVSSNMDDDFFDANRISNSSGGGGVGGGRKGATGNTTASSTVNDELERKLLLRRVMICGLIVILLLIGMALTIIFILI